jgi:hypothetical protein
MGPSIILRSSWIQMGSSWSVCVKKLMASLDERSWAFSGNDERIISLSFGEICVLYPDLCYWTANISIQ